jgi:hypothetical protein
VKRGFLGIRYFAGTHRRTAAVNAATLAAEAAGLGSGGSDAMNARPAPARLTELGSI